MGHFYVFSFLAFNFSLYAFNNDFSAHENLKINPFNV